MNTTATPDPLRRAALTLHALSTPDRAWLLRALPSLARDRLEPLLVELAALGIPADPRLARDADSAPSAPGPRAAPAWPHALDAQGVAALAGVLAGEPAGLTRALLSMHAWTWTPSLLAALDPARRAALGDTPLASEMAPRLKDAIVRALKARVDLEPQDAPAPPAGRWRRARAKLARIVRKS